MLINNRIEHYGLKKKFICEKFQVSDKTLYNWSHNKNIDNFIKFYKILMFLNININDIIKEYEKET